MGEENFSLTSNAFMVLKAGYASTLAEISDLAEDAEYSEAYPQDQIQRARQSLLAPLARLEQELGWMPELSPAQIDDISSTLVSSDPDRIEEIIEFYPELPRANVLAHLCETALFDQVRISNLIKAWDDIDETGLLEFINAKREVAGIPRVERSSISSAVRALRETHSRNAAKAVWTLPSPGKSMEAIVEAELARNPIGPLLTSFVREYDKLSEPHMARIGEGIDRLIDQVSQTTNDLDKVIDEISELLRKWDDINQPVQVFEQHQGHEEGRSKKIYQKLRALCLNLANERREFFQAKRLSEALLHTFPELESVAEQLRKDVETLENLDKQKKRSLLQNSPIKRSGPHLGPWKRPGHPPDPAPGSGLAKAEVAHLRGLDRQQRKNKEAKEVKWLIYGAIAAVIGLFLINDGPNTVLKIMEGNRTSELPDKTPNFQPAHTELVPMKNPWRDDWGKFVERHEAYWVYRKVNTCHAVTVATFTEPSLGWREERPFFEISVERNSDKVRIQLDEANKDGGLDLFQSGSIRAWVDEGVYFPVLFKGRSLKPLSRCEAGLCVDPDAVSLFRHGRKLFISGSTVKGEPAMIVYSLMGYTRAMQQINRVCGARADWIWNQ